MTPYIFSFSGVILGSFIALMSRGQSTKKVLFLLAFSGSFLLSLTVLSLIPSVYESASLSSQSIGLLIMAGISLQVFLEFYSKGAEHGHVHQHLTSHSVPWALFASLSIHSILEGFPLGTNSAILWGVVIHKVPIAIVLSTYLLASGYSKNKIIVLMTLFGITTPLGIYISQNFDYISKNIVYLNAIAIGIFLHVSTIILFESSKGHRFNLAKSLAVLLGILLAYGLVVIHH